MPQPPARLQVSYYYDPDIGDFYYGQGHPMKPHRVRLAHCLVTRYDLWHHLDIVRPCPARKSDLVAFHTPDYVDFLRAVTPANQRSLQRETAAGTVTAIGNVKGSATETGQIRLGGKTAARSGSATNRRPVMRKRAASHSRSSRHYRRHRRTARWLCDTDPCVQGHCAWPILPHFLRWFDCTSTRGGGVEEAFLTSDRVMTVSFHKHGDNFFPGTGDTADCGVGAGRGYAVNVPLRDGMDDPAYEGLFRPVMGAVMERFRPEAIVLQSGAGGGV
eukprot:XP_001690675.1 histone deacetylase [Chlamydomonas reinhardtii]